MNDDGGPGDVANVASRGRRRLRAPRDDRGVLIDPLWPQLPPLMAANQTARVSWNFSLAGEAANSFAAAARRQFFDDALAYTRAYRDVTLPNFADPSPLTPRPLLLAGHQPELFHAGVWAKNFALARLGAAVGAVPVNLVIDGDTLKAASLRVPTGSPAEPRVESVPFDAPQEEIPYEERGIADRSLFGSFGVRAAETIRPLVPNPLLETFWPEVVAQAEKTERLGAAVAQARHKLEGSWGLNTLELPQSRMCDSTHFRRFVGHMLSDLPRFVDVHNDELAAYRRREGIRSANHPVPALAREGDWLEAPFWLWTANQPRRRHVFLRRIGAEWELSDRGAVSLRLSLGDDRQESIAAALEEAARQGIRLRSRALITTMYARVVLSDLFLHGIGGGKYDELTDAIIERFFGCAAPGFAVVTATRKLPVEAPWASAGDGAFPLVDESTAERHLWELRHHPERFVDVAALPDDDERRTLAGAIETKRHWIVTAPTYQTAKTRCHAIRGANVVLERFLAPEREKWLKIQAQARERRRSEALLASREYSAFLLPEKDLRDFLLDIGASRR